MVAARPVAEGADAAGFWPLARRVGPKQIQQTHAGQRVAARVRIFNVRLKRATERYGASAAEHRANSKPKPILSTERRDLGRSQARVLPPVTRGQNLRAWESAARNERDT